MIFDLTHIIEENMPVYPGTEKPGLVCATTYEDDGFKETKISMFSHTGTHVDSPAHIFEGKKNLNEFPVDRLIGKALVINCRDLADGERVTMEKLKPYGEKLDNAEFLLFNFGWDVKWGTDEYYGNFPYLSGEVIDFVTKNNYKGIGVDVISIDPITDYNLTMHKRLFKDTEIINIENLKDLHLLGDDIFTLYCLPMHFKNWTALPQELLL